MSEINRSKIIDKFRKHAAPGIDGITTELINKAGPTLWNRMCGGGGKCQQTGDITNTQKKVKINVKIIEE
jgi:hypothetical protein